MYFVKTLKIVSLIYRSLIWEIPEKEKIIYLTFDDGPEEKFTPEILQILDRYKAKATFFCVGENSKKNPGIIQQIIKAGHAVGNHSYSHLKGNRTNTEEFINDIKKCNDILKTKLFRPPYGKISRRQIKRLKEDYNIIMWSVIPGDFDDKVSKELLLKRSIKYTKQGTIIVFHDNIKTKEKVLYALPKFLEHFINMGYNFEKINIACNQTPY
ncbi:MAG: hypothetical protein B6D61_14420 [Bacteroidetes bacterium 4484_249]|nr:MAG: hypothetical protein B6D61_14420 [Bacteroidetes bacterium 4484_249]